MSNWDQFVNVVLKGDYFLVFIAVIMIIVLAIIFYLVKLQIGSNEGEVKPKEKVEPKITQIASKDNIKEKKVKKEVKEPERQIYVQSKFTFNDDLENDLFQVTDEVLEKTQELNFSKKGIESVSSKVQNEKTHNERVQNEKVHNEKAMRERVMSEPKEEENVVLNTKREMPKEVVRENVQIPNEVKKEMQAMSKPQVKEVRVENTEGAKNSRADVHAVLNKLQQERNNVETMRVRSLERDKEAKVASTPLNEVKEMVKEVEASLNNSERRYAHIKEYEREQEESAIISYDELNKRKDDIEKGVFKISDEVIESYEEEQEKKAIISYDELLEKASSTVLSIKEEDVPGIKVSRIQTVNKNNPEPPKKPYYREEEFLKSLKEFRRAL